jgi:hypothetical protein
VPTPDRRETAARVAVRLHGAVGLNLLGPARIRLLIESLSAGADESGCLGFLDLDGIVDVVPDFARGLLQSEIDGGFPSVEKIYNWFSEDLSSLETIDAATGELDDHVTRLTELCVEAGLMFDEARNQLETVKARFVRELEEQQAELEEQEDRRADQYEDDWKERWQDQRHELEHGRFADVDE